MCGKNRTSHANRVLPLVLLMSHDLWDVTFARFSPDFIHFVGVKRGFGVVLC